MISKEQPFSRPLPVPRPPTLSLSRIRARRRVSLRSDLFPSPKDQEAGSLQEAHRSLFSIAKLCVKVLTRILEHQDIQDSLGWQRTELLNNQVRDFNAIIDGVVALATSKDNFVDENTKLLLTSATLVLAAFVVHFVCLLDKQWFNVKRKAFMADYQQTIGYAVGISSIDVPWAPDTYSVNPSGPTVITERQRACCEGIIKRGRFHELNAIVSVISNDQVWERLSWFTRQQGVLLMEAKAFSGFFDQIKAICTKEEWKAVVCQLPAGLMKRKAEIEDVASRAYYHLNCIKPEVRKAVSQWIGEPLFTSSAQRDEPSLRSGWGNTGSWFIDSTEYQSWYKSPAGSSQRFLWCLGGIGMGKSMLMTAVVDNQTRRLREHIFQPRPIMIKIYFHYNEWFGAENLLKCILQQVVEQMSVPTALMMSIYESLKDGVVIETGMDVLYNILVEVTEDYPTYFFLDGLDACQPTVLQETMKQLISLGPHHRIICFSRPSLSTRKQAFPNFTFWSIKAHESDIKHRLEFIKEIVNASPDTELSPSEEAQVIDTALSNAEGCFDLLERQIESALWHTTRQKLTSAVLEIPDTVYPRYSFTMLRIEQTSARTDLLYKIIAWVMVLEKLSVSKDLPRLLPTEEVLSTSFAQDLVDECLGILSLRDDHIVFSHYLSKAFISTRFSRYFPDFISTTQSWISSFGGDSEIKDLSDSFDRFTRNQNHSNSDVARFLPTHQLAIEN